MKKLLLTTAMFLCVNAYSQIKNLNDLLRLSVLSENVLPEALYKNWDVNYPSSGESSNGKNIIEKFGFDCLRCDKKQRIEREITISKAYNFKMSQTYFYSNDWELLKKIKAELLIYGYKQKKTIAASYFSFYSNGKSSISIVDKPTKEVPALKNGYFMVGVFIN